jgi:hypothetical protein
MIGSSPVQYQILRIFTFREREQKHPSSSSYVLPLDISSPDGHQGFIFLGGCVLKSKCITFW